MTPQPFGIMTSSNWGVGLEVYRQLARLAARVGHIEGFFALSPLSA
jgi:hypothetical protein